MYDRTFVRAVLALLSLSLLAGPPGCADADPVEPIGEATTSIDALAPAAAASGAALERDLADLRRATARYHRFEAAVAAGHDVLVVHPETGARCLEHPALGGMGRHYLDLDLLDSELDVSQPEVLIYEPERNGRLRLVAVEYLVPFSEVGQEEPAPELFGQALVPNEVFGVWALHVWHMKHNPLGIFADWHPEVSCEFDAEAGD
jgi:hypothetical protein